MGHCLWQGFIGTAATLVGRGGQSGDKEDEAASRGGDNFWSFRSVRVKGDREEKEGNISAAASAAAKLHYSARIAPKNDRTTRGKPA